jgi:hypothetical protein
MHPVALQLDILFGFRGIAVSRGATALPLRPRKYRAQELKDNYEAGEVTGQVVFSPGFPEPSAGPLRT